MIEKDRTMSLPSGWVDDVLKFWFIETSREQWFKKDDAFDAQVRSRFQDLHEALCARKTEEFLAAPRVALAAIIVLDQMSRNMFRGSPRAFAQDEKALAIAESIVEKRLDRDMTMDERMFCYLPFEHAEDLAAQANGVALVAALGDPDLLKWAQAHKVIIDRFGRFPHRNAVLERRSTPEEIEFLKEPGSSF
jgi:uncharacterized protein (DUF924 family)